jgi:anti-sigma factor RsiW
MIMHVPCEDMQKLFEPFLDGGLPRRERKRLEAHIEGCVACRDALSEERAVVKALETLPKFRCPDRVTRRVEATVLGGTERLSLFERFLPRGGFPWRFVTAGLALATVIVLVIVRPLMERPPTPPVAYSEEDAGLVRDQAVWSLAYVAKTMEKKERNVLEEVLLNDLPETVRNSLKNAIPLLKGGG